MRWFHFVTLHPRNSGPFSMEIYVARLPHQNHTTPLYSWGRGWKTINANDKVLSVSQDSYIIMYHAKLWCDWLIRKLSKPVICKSTPKQQVNSSLVPVSQPSHQCVPLSIARRVCVIWAWMCVERTIWAAGVWHFSDGFGRFMLPLELFEFCDILRWASNF